MKIRYILYAICVTALCSTATSCSKSETYPTIEGYGAILHGDKNWSVIDNDGNVLVKNKFDIAPTAVCSGRFAVGEPGNVKVYAVDNPDAPLNKEPFGEITAFNSGHALAVRAGTSIFVVDADCRTVAVLDDNVVEAHLLPIPDKFAYCDKSGKWGVMNFEGNEKESPKFATFDQVLSANGGTQSHSLVGGKNIDKSKYTAVSTHVVESVHSGKIYPHTAVNKLLSHVNPGGWYSGSELINEETKLSRVLEIFGLSDESEANTKKYPGGTALGLDINLGNDCKGDAYIIYQKAPDRKLEETDSVAVERSRVLMVVMRCTPNIDPNGSQHTNLIRNMIYALEQGVSNEGFERVGGESHTFTNSDGRYVYIVPHRDALTIVYSFYELDYKQLMGTALVKEDEGTDTTDRQ